MIYAFFVKQSFLTKNYFFNAEIHLTTRGPFLSCCSSNSNIFHLIQCISSDFGWVNLTVFASHGVILLRTINLPAARGIDMKSFTAVLGISDVQN